MAGGSWRGLPFSALRIPRGLTVFDVAVGLVVATGIPMGLLLLVYGGYLMPTMFTTAWLGAQLLAQPIAVWVAVSRRRTGSVLGGLGVASLVIGLHLLVQMGLVAVLAGASDPFWVFLPESLWILTPVMHFVAAPASFGAAMWAGLHQRAAKLLIERTDADWADWETS